MAKAQDASDLRHRVALQRPSDASDGQGGASRSWTTVATVWAQVTPGAGGERVIAQGVREQSPYDVRIRYRADVTAAWRILWSTTDPYGNAISVVLDVQNATTENQEYVWTDLHCMAGEGS